MKFAAPIARGSHWGNPDGSQQPVIRISAGKQTLVVEYGDILPLIAELARLTQEHMEEGDHGERTRHDSCA